METEALELPLMHRLWAWFETNKKQAGIAAGVVVVAGLIMWFVSWQRDQKEISAGEALSSVSTFQTVNGTARQDAAEVYLRLASEYANTSSGARALLLAAGTYFTDGKYDQALKSFQRFTREHRDSPWMGEALLGTASCQEVLGKTNEAMAIYQDIKDHHSSDVEAAQAKFALARLYETQNKPELARPLYEDLARNEPYSSIGSEAGIRLEELMARSAAPATLTQAPAPAAPVVMPPAVPASTNPVPFKLEER
jgi:predicted negative regulator of RcsB-dependent stress response